MNKTLLPPKQTLGSRLLLYGVTLILALVASALGILAAAIALWQALLAGSIWYMPLGLLLLLGAIAIIYSHKLFDLALLGLLLVAVMAWFMVDALQQAHLLEALLVVASRTYLMAGMMLAMVMTLVLIHSARRAGRW